MASGREGGLGSNDIWVADRFDTDEAFGEAYNLGAPVNSADADYCPTPLNGFYLMFVSTQSGPDACGGGDIHIVRRNPAHGPGLQGGTTMLAQGRKGLPLFMGMASAKLPASAINRSRPCSTSSSKRTTPP
jgi:hypothetical protein